MIENKRVLVMLSLVVIASGCAQTTGTTESEASTSSVTIQNFSADRSQILSNQPARLSLTLVNEGGTDAENVVARIFNVVTESESGDADDWSIDGSSRISFGTLESADEENNLPARDTTRRWSLTAANLDPGTTIPYRFITEVNYRYETRGTSSITLMSSDRARQQGEPQRPSIDTTAGPIQLQLDTRSPIVFYPGETSQVRDMCITVTNTGSGTPFLYSDGVYEDGNYDVTDELSNRVELTVPDQGGVEFTPVRGSGNTAAVELLDGSFDQCFEIDADNWNENLAPQTEIPIVVEAKYGYSKEASETITVEGSNRFGDAPATDGGDESEDGSSDDSDGGAAGSGPGPGN